MSCGRSSSKQMTAGQGGLGVPDVLFPGGACKTNVSGVNLFMIVNLVVKMV